MMPTAFATRIALFNFILLLAACGSDRLPTRADVPDIMAEAQGTKPVSKWRDSKAREAVRSSFRSALYFDSMHQAEVRTRFQRPELRSYLLLEDSYVGGDFPRRIAGLLREVQQADQLYVQQVASYPELLASRLARLDLSDAQRAALHAEMTQAYAARQQPVLATVAVIDTFVHTVARLYEMMASNQGAFQSKLAGLEFSDVDMLRRYNGMVDEVNRAHAAADSAIRRLPPEHQAHFRRMGLATPVRK
ncbi:MAG TPA: hypothetical protein VGD27_00215 [Longimicrobiales bacterium]